jgi:hypothetical protein
MSWLPWNTGANQHYVIILNGIEDNVIARCEAPQFRGQIRTAPPHARVFSQEPKRSLMFLHDTNGGFDPTAFARDL